MRKFTILLMLLLASSAQAARIKDVAQVAGVRNNQLVGYGLVTGLPGTGESTPFTDQSFNAMLQSFGIQLPPGTKPKTKNVAAVIVTADLPAFWSNHRYHCLFNWIGKKFAWRYLDANFPERFGWASLRGGTR